MGGSKQQTTKTEEKRDPYAPSVPALQTLISGSLKAYNSGAGSGVYTGDRVAGLGGTSQGGLDYIKSNASAGLDSAQSGNSFLNTLLANGGATAGTTAATQNLLGIGTADTSGIAGAAGRMADPNSAAAKAGRTLTGGAYNLDGSGYADLNAGLSGPSQTQRSLQGVADGAYLGGANPYLDKLIGASNADALNAVKQSFASSGRYGSGMFANAAADALSRNENTLRYSDYDAERQRQATAAGAIDAQTLARTGARQSLYGAQNDTRTANANQLIQGASLSSGADQAALTGQQALFNALTSNNQQQIGQYTTALAGAQGDRAAAQSGLSSVPGVQSALLQPGKTLLAAGQTEDQVRQQQLAAAQDLFNDKQNAPWKALGLLAGTTIPVANAGGTSSGTAVQTTPQPSFLQQLLGTALAGAQVASKFV